MKTRLLWILLLLSLGLNVGLALNLWRRDAAAPPPAGPTVGPAPGSFPGERADERAGPARGADRTRRMLRHRLDRLAARLDLTAAQRDSLWALHRQAGPGVLARRQALAAARTRMHDLLAATPLEAPALHRVRRQISRLQAELDSVVVSLLMRERAVLSAEQASRYRGLFPLGGGEGKRGGRDGGRHRHRTP